jgi:transcriptional regulator NrdR family protein
VKCPKCNKEGKQLVLESRPHDGRVYRRRQCPHCGATFVTEEIAHTNMVLPRASGWVRTAAARATADEKRAIRGDASELAQVWR